MAAPTIIATPGAADANSYCTLTEANTYHDSRLHVSAWAGASDDSKKAALVWATRLLDEQIVWEGYSTDPDVQALQWPRVDMYDPISGGLYDMVGALIPDDEIPQQLKNAEAELARWLISSDRTLEQSTDGVAGLTVGPINLKFSETSPARRKVIPDAVFEMVAYWGQRRFRKSGAVPLVRV